MMSLHYKLITWGKSGLDSSDSFSPPPSPAPEDDEDYEQTDDTPTEDAIRKRVQHILAVVSKPENFTSARIEATLVDLAKFTSDYNPRDNYESTFYEWLITPDLIDGLHNLMLYTVDSNVKREVIRCFHHLVTDHTDSFFLPDIMSCCIRALGENDESIVVVSSELIPTLLNYCDEDLKVSFVMDMMHKVVNCFNSQLKKLGKSNTLDYDDRELVTNKNLHIIIFLLRAIDEVTTYFVTLDIKYFDAYVQIFMSILNSRHGVIVTRALQSLIQVISTKGLLFTPYNLSPLIPCILNTMKDPTITPKMMRLILGILVAMITCPVDGVSRDPERALFVLNKIESTWGKLPFFKFLFDQDREMNEMMVVMSLELVGNFHVSQLIMVDLVDGIFSSIRGVIEDEEEKRKDAYWTKPGTELLKCLSFVEVLVEQCDHNSMVQLLSTGIIGITYELLLKFHDLKSVISPTIKLIMAILRKAEHLYPQVEYEFKKMNGFRELNSLWLYKDTYVLYDQLSRMSEVKDRSEVMSLLKRMALCP